MDLILCGEIHTVHQCAFPSRAKGQVGLNGRKPVLLSINFYPLWGWMLHGWRSFLKQYLIVKTVQQQEVGTER